MGVHNGFCVNWSRYKKDGDILLWFCESDDILEHALWFMFHSTDVIMSLMASQITSLTIVYSPVCSGTDQRKDRISASLAFVRGIHRGPVNSRHKRPVTRKMFSFDDVIMLGFVHFIRQRRFKQNACFDTKPMSEQPWRKLTLKCRANVLTYSHVGAGTKQSKFYQSIFLNKSRCIFIQVS